MRWMFNRIWRTTLKILETDSSESRIGELTYKEYWIAKGLIGKVVVTGELTNTVVGHGFTETKNMGSMKGEEGQNDFGLKENMFILFFLKENHIDK